MKNLIKFIWSLRPSKAREAMRNVRDFRHCDDFKMAIYYGKLLYLENHYTKSGQKDLAYRSKKVDEIISMYRYPVDHNEHLSNLMFLREGVIQADADGLVNVPNSPKISKEEADKHQRALDSLDYLINAIKYHPIIWRSVFLARS